MLWRAVDRKPSELLVAMSMPSQLIANLLELDSLYQKMESQYIEEQAKNDEKAKSKPKGPGVS